MNEPIRQTDDLNVVERHFGLICKVARGFATNEHDFDDLVQEIAINVWQAFGSFDYENAETTFVYRVATNRAISWYRKRKRSRKLLGEFAIWRRQNAPTPHRSDCRLEMLYAAIQRLSEVERALVIMHLDAASYEQMAEVIGISVSNVGVKLNRAKTKLKRIIELGENQ
ncbi:MAG: sigma-70 family RNA polymerase sigma factor [Planctomycetota bacterium]